MVPNLETHLTTEDKDIVALVLLVYTYANSDTHFSTLPAYVITF